MIVCRHFRLKQCYGLFAAQFAEIAQAQSWALSGLHGRGALKIWQSKSALAVATIGGAQKSEERRVLADRHQLAIAKGPACGSKVERKDSYFSYELIRHKKKRRRTHSPLITDKSMNCR